MSVFETQIIVTKSDLDEFKHVNNVQYVHWVNDIAKLHWEQNANKEILENYYWVVLNHRIQYKSSARINDLLNIKTYVKRSEGVKSIRVVEITQAKNNKLIVTSETTWCFMNRKTNRPLRIPQEIINLFH